MRIPLMAKNTSTPRGRLVLRKTDQSEESKTLKGKIPKQESTSNNNTELDYKKQMKDINYMVDAENDDNHDLSIHNPISNFLINKCNNCNNILDLINKSTTDNYQQVNNDKNSINKIIDLIINEKVEADDLLKILESPKFKYSIELYIKISKSKYFFFLRESIYKLLLNIFTDGSENRGFQIQAFNFLIEEFPDLNKTFSDLLKNYSLISNYKMEGNISFRNFILESVVNKILFNIYLQKKPLSVISENNKNKKRKIKKSNVECNQTDLAESFLFLNNLNICIPFTEFILKNSKKFINLNIMLIYAYNFLSSIKVDLLDLKSNKIIESNEDHVISRIFSRMYALYHSTIDKHNVNDIITNPTTNNNLVVEFDSFINNLGFLRILFQSNNLKAIILTIYKRLFFYFLNKNKRILSSIEIHRIFSKKEKSFIFRELKSSPVSLINIFKQIDQRYLLRVLKETNFLKETNNQKKNIIVAIEEDELIRTGSDLRIFYSLYFDILESERIAIPIKIKNVDLFSKEFNKRLDKSYISYIQLEASRFEYKSLDFLIFLYFYTASDIFKECNVVVIELVSILLDSSIIKTTADFQNNDEILYYNYTLKILFNLYKYFNKGLIYNIVPTLRKLVFNSYFTLNAGLLYRKLFDYYGFKDEFFNSNIYQDHPLSLMVYGSVNSSMFISNHIKDDDLDITCNLGKDAIHCNMERDIKEAAFLFYLYYNPSYADFNLLRNILSRRNRNTVYLIEFLIKDTSNHLFSFVSQSINLLYELLDIDSVYSLFLKSLKNKAVLPHMVIPYIIIKYDVGFIYRNYLSPSINCINDCVHLTYNRIKSKISDYKQGEGDNNMLELDKLEIIFNSEISNDYLFQLSKYCRTEQIIEKLEYQNDILIVFIVLRNIRLFKKDEKLMFFKDIEESVSDEKIYELLSYSRNFYEKNSEGILPVDCLFES